MAPLSYKNLTQDEITQLPEVLHELSKPKPFGSSNVAREMRKLEAFKKQYGITRHDVLKWIEDERLPTDDLHHKLRNKQALYAYAKWHREHQNFRKGVRIMHIKYVLADFVRDTGRSKVESPTEQTTENVSDDDEDMDVNVGNMDDEDRDNENDGDMDDEDKDNETGDGDMDDEDRDNENENDGDMDDADEDGNIQSGDGDELLFNNAWWEKGKFTWTTHSPTIDPPPQPSSRLKSVLKRKEREKNKQTDVPDTRGKDRDKEDNTVDEQQGATTRLGQFQNNIDSLVHDIQAIQDARRTTNPTSMTTPAATTKAPQTEQKAMDPLKEPDQEHMYRMLTHVYIKPYQGLPPVAVDFFASGHVITYFADDTKKKWTLTHSPRIRKFGAYYVVDQRLVADDTFLHATASQMLNKVVPSTCLIKGSPRGIVVIYGDPNEPEFDVFQDDGITRGHFRLTEGIREVLTWRQFHSIEWKKEGGIAGLRKMERAI
jgi:hypothetical protein